MKIIDGQIRKVEPLSKEQVFFDFEFWGESDEDTYGLLCLVQRSNPKKLFITEMDSHEISISNDKQAFQVVKERIARETGITDLIFPKILRFENKKNDVTKSFKSYLKAYQKPVPIYESIFNSKDEAVQTDSLSIKEFLESNGEIVLFGNIKIQS